MNSKVLESLTSLADLGEFVRAARRRKKLSQATLGERAGLSRMPVYRLEAGRDVSLASFLAMLPPLGLSLKLDEQATGPLRVSDLARAFAHLHGDDEDS